MECREVREYLPAYTEQAGGPRAATVDDHLTACGGCRAELEQYRELGSEMRALAGKPGEPPAWLLGTVTEAVAERAARRAALRARRERLAHPRVVVAGGAIVLAGVAGAMLLSGRRRRRVNRKLREALAQA